MENSEWFPIFSLKPLKIVFWSETAFLFAWKLKRFGTFENVNVLFNRANT